MITKKTIDSVYDQARVEEVIGDFVHLKKSGANYKALSPFTQERTPSFFVSPVKQIWKDFSSGKGGNVVAFLMEHEKFSYPEAITYLAKKYGIPIEEKKQTPAEKQQADETESLYSLTTFATGYFEETFYKSTFGKEVAKKFFRQRGFEEAVIKKFRLGCSPPNRRALYHAAIKAQYSQKFLISSGLCIETVDGPYDRFNNRIIFPIRSIGGRIQGFGGRSLTEQKKTAKYLNSPESLIYSKSKQLYGIYESKNSIVRSNHCYLVEGYTDVIKLHQLGIDNVLATSGTSLSTYQIAMIKRFTTNVTFLFDGDQAGLKAAMRGIDQMLPFDINISVCRLPPNEDPDSFASKNKAEIVRTYFEQKAVDFLQFKTQLLLEETTTDPAKKSEVIKEIVKSIALITNQLKVELYLQECSRMFQVSEKVLFGIYYQEKRLSSKVPSRAPTSYPKKNNLRIAEKQPTDNEDQYQKKLEEKIIGILVLYGNHEAQFDEPPRIITTSDESNNQVVTVENDNKVVGRKIFEKIFLELQQDEYKMSINNFFQPFYEQLIRMYQDEGKLNEKELLYHENSKVGEFYAEIISDKDRYPLHNWKKKNIYVEQPDKKLSKIVDETILNLRCQLIQQRTAQLAQKVKQHQLSTEEREDLFSEIKYYTQLKRKIFTKLNRVA